MRRAILEFTAARDQFLDRWQLCGLAGPFLPDPVRAQVPVLRSAADERMQKMGVTLFLPRIYPLPDRQAFREMVEDAVGRAPPAEHLRDWMEIVGAERNNARRSNATAAFSSCSISGGSFVQDTSTRSGSKGQSFGRRSPPGCTPIPRAERLSP